MSIIDINDEVFNNIKEKIESVKGKYNTSVRLIDVADKLEVSWNYVYSS